MKLYIILDRKKHGKYIINKLMNKYGILRKRSQTSIKNQKSKKVFFPFLYRSKLIKVLLKKYESSYTNNKVFYLINKYMLYKFDKESKLFLK